MEVTAIHHPPVLHPDGPKQNVIFLLRLCFSLIGILTWLSLLFLLLVLEILKQ